MMHKFISVARPFLCLTMDEYERVHAVEELVEGGFRDGMLIRVVGDGGFSITGIHLGQASTDGDEIRLSAVTQIRIDVQRLTRMDRLKRILAFCDESTHVEIVGNMCDHDISGLFSSGIAGKRFRGEPVRYRKITIATATLNVDQFEEILKHCASRACLILQSVKLVGDGQPTFPDDVLFAELTLRGRTLTKHLNQFLMHCAPGCTLRVWSEVDEPVLLPSRLWFSELSLGFSQAGTTFATANQLIAGCGAGAKLEVLITAALDPYRVFVVPPAVSFSTLSVGGEKATIGVSQLNSLLMACQDGAVLELSLPIEPQTRWILEMKPDRFLSKVVIGVKKALPLARLNHLIRLMGPASILEWLPGATIEGPGSIQFADGQQFSELKGFAELITDSKLSNNQRLSLFGRTTGTIWWGKIPAKVDSEFTEFVSLLSQLPESQIAKLSRRHFIAAMAVVHCMPTIEPGFKDKFLSLMEATFDHRSYRTSFLIWLNDLPHELLPIKNRMLAIILKRISFDRISHSRSLIRSFADMFAPPFCFDPEVRRAISPIVFSRIVRRLDKRWIVPNSNYLALLIPLLCKTLNGINADHIPDLIPIEHTSQSISLPQLSSLVNACLYAAYSNGRAELWSESRMRLLNSWRRLLPSTPMGVLDLADNEAEIYGFVGDNKDHQLTIWLDHRYLKECLVDQTRRINPTWYRLVCYRNGNCVPSEQVDLDQIFGSLPPFKQIFDDLKQAPPVLGIVGELPLQYDRKQDIRTAVSSGAVASRIKWISPEIQQELSEDFGPSFIRSIDVHGVEDRTRVQIVPALLAKFEAHFSDEIRTDYDRYGFYLALSAFFAYISSVSVFGGDGDNSPNAIRVLSTGLLNSTIRLAVPHTERRVHPDSIQDWIYRLMAIGDAFTCSGVVSDSMQDTYIQIPNVRRFLELVMPSKWIKHPAVTER